MFTKAVKTQAKLRLAIAGPSGAGKTYTALKIASHLTEQRIALVDTEHGSASKYADDFDFDVLELDPPFHPDRFLSAIREAAKAGYGVIILDSLSHAWNGTGGLLDIVDEIAKRMRTANTFAAWKDAAPLQNKFIDGLIGADIHVIATMRSKQDYIQDTDANGKTRIRKVGMAPVQRDGFEYEFDVFLEMDIENNALVTKTRCSALTGKVFSKPGEEIAATLRTWLHGAPIVKRPPLSRDENGHLEGEALTEEYVPDETTRPYSAAYTCKKLREIAENFARAGNGVKEAEQLRGVIRTNLEACFADRDAGKKRKTVLDYVFSVTSTKDLTPAQVKALHKWLDAKPDSGGAWMPNADSVTEARALYEAALLAQGQTKMF